MDVTLQNGFMEIMYASLFIFWIVYLYFVKHYGYWEQRNAPHEPAVFPFGSLKDIVLGRSYFGISLDIVYKKFENERYVGLIEIRNPALLVRDPELIKLILQNDFHHFMDHQWVDIHPNDFIFNNLFNMKGPEWKKMRHKLTPAYTAAKMKMMFFLVKKCSNIFSEALLIRTKENSIIDVNDILARFTIDVIGTCVLGLEVNCLNNKDSQLYKIAVKLNSMDYLALIKIYIYNAFPIFSKVHCFNVLDSEITNFISELVRSTIQYREKYNVTRFDFMDLLIKLKQNQSILEEGENPTDFYDTVKSGKKEGGLTMEEIIAEIFLFFLAGYESTTFTILFCLYELACHSKIQDQLFCEVTEVMNLYEEKMCYQALQEMTYMDQVIKESMRCYPIFPQLFRICTENYKVPNSSLEIEKGMRIIIPAYSLHHDPKYFPDPYNFDPERFNPKNLKEHHSFAFLPFGEGPRMCIGFRFGMMQVKTALATLMSEYIISLAPDTPVPLPLKGNSYITQPLQPLMLEFTRRQTKV